MAQDYQAYHLINHLYYPEDIQNGDNAEEQILKKYITDDQEKLKNAINIPDIITNINGNHEYKLISGKDIDFENMFLPNSAISENGWNNFPEERRWASGASLRINEMYELMNVIDYLLCATNNLFNEINKLKYDDENENIIWFVSNAISQSPQYYLQDHIKSTDFETGNEYGLNITYLNPKQYSTAINAKNEDKSTYSFGVATTFNDDNYHMYKFTRILKNKYGSKRVFGLEGQINEQGSIEYNTQTNYMSSIIYGYQIGTDLHLYPGFNIFNFFVNDTEYCTTMQNFVDVKNKCLKYCTYFKYNKTIFKKIFIEFLVNTGSNKGNEYILYIINDNKKEIIYSSNPNIVQSIITYNTYEVYDYGNGSTGIKNQYVYSVEDDLYIPYLYRIKDSNNIELNVITPKTSNYDIQSTSLEIKYFKNKNNITVKVFNNDNEKEIKQSTEYQQDDILLYNPTRYNIPEKTDIKVDITANILNKESENTQYLKDDEYLDYPYYWNNNSSDSLDNMNASEYLNYYKFNELDNITPDKRVFTQFDSLDDFKNFLRTNQFSSDEACFTQVYKKIENPYDIEFDTTVSELLEQSCEYNRLTQIIKDIKENHIEKDEDNNLTISYILPDDIEQIKFDLDLLIEETGKTKEGYYKVPLNLNRIHHVSINFNNPQLYIEEANRYNDFHYGVTQTSAINNLTVQNRYSSEEWKNNMKDDNVIHNGLTTFYNEPTPGKYLTASDLYQLCSGELNNLNTNMNILSFLNSEFDDFNSWDKINNTCYLDNRSYDNTINGGRILYLTYNNTNYYLNLIGGSKLNNNLISRRNNTVTKYFAMAYIMNNGEKIDLNLQANGANGENYAQIFAVHGLGFNYYCHGADSYAWSSRNNNYYGFNNAKNSHNLLTPCDLNESSNINKFLGISISQKDVLNNETIKDYVSYICVQNEDEDKKYYKVNDNILYQGEFLTSYDSIITDCISINKRQYSYAMIKEEKLPNVTPVSYYLQTSYIKVLNSTFYPKPSSFPPLHYDNEHNFIGAYYDLNDENELIKYIDYKNSFGSDINGGDNSYYRPITLSLKFEENLDNGIPFFYESNVAKLKMNIVRDVNTKESPIFVGINKTSLISPELKYYMSDFTEINIARTGDTADLKSYTGSYLYLDLDNYEENHIITFKEKLFEANHEYTVTNGISHIILKNNFSFNDYTIPYPIPAKFKNNNDDELYYFYDIIRLAEINKVKLSNYSIKSEDEAGMIGNNYDNDPCKINYELMTIDFTNTIYPNIYNDLTKTIELHLDPTAHYGSRNYHSNTTLSGSTGARVSFKYIHREYNSDMQTSLYQTLEYNNNDTIIKYDLFEYSFDFNDIAIRIHDNDDDTDKYYTLEYAFNLDKQKYRNDDAFNNNSKDDNIYRYYRTQVEAFMDYRIYRINELTDVNIINGDNENNGDDEGR